MININDRIEQNPPGWKRITFETTAGLSYFIAVIFSFVLYVFGGIPLLIAIIFTMISVFLLIGAIKFHILFHHGFKRVFMIHSDEKTSKEFTKQIIRQFEKTIENVREKNDINYKIQLLNEGHLFLLDNKPHVAFLLIIEPYKSAISILISKEAQEYISQIELKFKM